MIDRDKIDKIKAAIAEKLESQSVTFQVLALFLHEFKALELGFVLGMMYAEGRVGIEEKNKRVSDENRSSKK